MHSQAIFPQKHSMSRGMGLRLSYWFPVVVVIIGVVAVYSLALTPLPANGFGRTIYDVHTTFSVPPGSSMPILVGGEQEISTGSLVVITAGILNRVPQSDSYEHAHFLLTYAGSALEESVANAFSLSLETPGATTSADNPRLVIRNDHPFPLEVEYRAFVVRPPTVWEKFSMFVGGVVIAGVLAAMWPLYTVTIGRGERERSA